MKINLEKITANITKWFFLCSIFKLIFKKNFQNDIINLFNSMNRCLHELCIPYPPRNIANEFRLLNFEILSVSVWYIGLESTIQNMYRLYFVFYISRISPGTCTLVLYQFVCAKSPKLCTPQDLLTNASGEFTTNVQFVDRCAAAVIYCSQLPRAQHASAHVSV